MDWVKNFYSRTGQWWGPAHNTIDERDRRRVDTARNILGLETGTMLELGAGYGTTAAAAAESGFSVTAVEISDRVHFAPDRPGVQLIKADFYAVQLGRKYDVVCYWNGFGIGSDADQRRLLRRISEEWLAPGGCALIDISSPFVWAGWNGDTEDLSPDPARGYHYRVGELTKFDPVQCRAIDSWWEADSPDDVITQTLRCYTPADLQLLLEGTGLRLEYIHLDGERIDVDRPHPGLNSLLHKHHEYLAVLTPAKAAPQRRVAGAAAG